MSKKKRAKMQENRQPVILHPLNKSAFTLAEVLITLGIIGVVASMTIPTLMTNVSNRQFETGAKKTEATLIQALLMMKANNALVGHETTENFVNELKNYLKIAKTCEAGSLSGCYPEEFTAGDENYILNEMSGSASLGHEDWNTNLSGFVLNNGTSFLTAYNPGCMDDNYRNCAAFVYDMNSIDKNNKFSGKNGESDLAVYNADFAKTSPACQLTCNASSMCVFNCDSNMDIYEYYDQHKAELDQMCADTWPGRVAGIIIDNQIYCTCIARGTLISLADGSNKKIEDLSFDDDLLVWDFDNGRMSSAKPVWLKIGEVTEKYNLLTFSDGTQLKTIVQHRIFNKDLGKFTYPMTDDTPLGTTTLLADGREVQLVEKKVVYEPVEYYNLITEYHFNCFANGVLTSNRFNNLYPIQDYKFIKDNRELTPYSEYENFVSRDWYERLRLAEQTCDEEMKLYLSFRVMTNKKELALV